MSESTARPDREQEPADGRSWLDVEVDGRPVRFWMSVGVVIAAVTLGLGAWWVWGLDAGTEMVVDALTWPRGRR